jgi:hypothetical protein
VGEYRRKAVGAHKLYNFYHPDNKEAVEARKKCATAALIDVQNFLLNENGQAAVSYQEKRIQLFIYRPQTF